MAAQKTTIYVDTLPIKRVPRWLLITATRRLSAALYPPQIQLP